MQHIPTPPEEATTSFDRKRSPPPSPPAPDPNGNDNESQLPRKREREVSLEPATSAKAIPDTARTPAKKNKVHLGKTTEEDTEASLNNNNNSSNNPASSRSRTPSPPITGSPPHEFKVKVRQISQGVEDLTWRKKNAAATTATTVEEEKESSSSEEDKGLKRRATSAAPEPEAEATKRPRDDPDKDVNPRETKRPSPPPDKQREKEIEEAKKAAAKPSGFLSYMSNSSPFKTATSSTSSQSNRPSTPPIQDKATPKMSGFMAYASTNSPFATVKGSSIFSSTPSRSIAPFNNSQGSSSMTPSKRSGFEAFASSESPFVQARRSKSPVLGSSSDLGRSKSPSRRGTPANVNAFSSYASSGISPFASHKRVKTLETAEPSPPLSGQSTPENPANNKNGKEAEGEDDSEENEHEHEEGSFGARLRAGKDDESAEETAKPNLTERDVVTGEEDEYTIHQVRGKLYALDGSQWKERGTGMLKLNVRRQDGERPRLIMRKEAVYTILLNVPLFKGMKCVIAQDPRYIRLSVIENGTTEHYNVRVGSAKAAEEMLEEINANIPGSGDLAEAGV